MIKKLGKYIVFISLLFIIYILSNIIYERSMADTLDVLFYCGIIAFLGFVVNLIKVKKYKWLILFVINIICLVVILGGLHNTRAYKLKKFQYDQISGTGAWDQIMYNINNRERNGDSTASGTICID